MSLSSAGEVDIQIDLRNAWASIRDQGSRSACLACATSDAHSHCHELNRPLSAEFLFYHAGQLMPAKDVTDGLTFEAVDVALRSEGQPDEAEWPYSITQPTPWTPPPVSRRWHGGLVPSAGDVKALVKTLETKQPVVLGLRLTAAFLSPTVVPHIVAPNGRGFGGHAVLAVGLGAHRAYGSLLLIRNSWGDGWADRGHAWLPVQYLNDKLIGYRTLSALTQL